ncbi:hypothetical protein L6R49_28720 [Myxococcota bacterium]|nr:hypothetical protein [Myxococcota bacterium]
MRFAPISLLTLFLFACDNKDVVVGEDSAPPTGSDSTVDSEPDDSDDTEVDDTETDDTGPQDEDNDGDGVPASEDCDDDDASTYPDAAELCDGADNDCDGEVDEDVLGVFYTDADNDGYGDDSAPVEACEQPEGTSALGGDCDDADPSYNPAAEEADCTDPNDYNCDGSVGYDDNDGDGFAACEECDDGDAGSFPGAEEVCDERDNDCDADVDEGVTTTYYRDADADGWGDADFPAEACSTPTGYTEGDGDCDDTVGTINPDATEVCDSLDNDCDTLIDGEDDSLDLGTATTYYDDADGDGYGDSGTGALACEAPSGATTVDGDCDDSDGAVSPAASEVCDDADNDCDGLIDDADSSLDSSTASTWYADSDGDSSGDASVSVQACERPSGYIANARDCDDADAAVSHRATEICDGIDNDCDKLIDDADSSTSSTSKDSWYTDADSDGYGAGAASLACDQPAGSVENSDDCDDADAAINPDAVELCDFVDDDCDGVVDNDLTDADASGVADCKEFAVIMSYGFNVRSGGVTCDGIDTVQYEFESIETALNSVGLGAVRLDETSTGGLTFANVSGYAGVAYHNGGWSDAAASSTETLLNSAAAAGMALWFLGDDGSYNVLNTASATGKSTMYTLSHVGAFVSNGGGGTVTATASGSSHPVISGPAGSVGSFSYSADLDYTTLAGTGEIELMRSSTGYPAVWAAESSAGQRMLFTLPSINNSHTRSGVCVISDSAGLAELQVLAANGGWWLLNF